ncbi:MAG: Bcr/CflA family multidrug efflux MFS transporter [Pseudomonadales bacterium]|nr:Bcr/CflA family multidrug efflux MFS transporter [Pseudomonadales bacterium]
MTSQQRIKVGDTELIILLGLLSAIGPLSVDTYLPGLPAMASEFAVAVAGVERSVSSYLLGLAAGQVLAGPLSDRYGRRPVLLVGLGLALLASLACAYATDADTLVLARAVQGLGTAAMPAAGRAMIRDVWSGDQAARAMSFVLLVMAFAPLVAPLLGGQLYVYFGWRSIFWLLGACSVLLMALVLFRLPETNRRERREEVKLLTYFTAYGQVLASGRAWRYLLCGGLSYAIMFAYITGSPAVYIGLFGVDPQHFGFFFALNVIALMLGNWLNTRYVARWGYRRLLGIGTVVSLLGVLALLACAYTGAGGLPAIVITLFIAMSPVGATGANAAVGLLNQYPHNAGGASAMFGVAQFGFGALAGFLVGVFHAGSAVAMALSMLLMAGGAFIAGSGLWLGAQVETKT